jgi:hypothetical protein
MAFAFRQIAVPLPGTKSLEDRFVRSLRRELASRMIPGPHSCDWHGKSGDDAIRKNRLLQKPVRIDSTLHTLLGVSMRGAVLDYLPAFSAPMPPVVEGGLHACRQFREKKSKTKSCS